MPAVRLGQWSEDCVVLIGAAEGLPFAGEDSDHLAGHVLDADLLADHGSARDEQLLHYGLAENADLRGRGVLLAPKGMALGERPVADLEVGGSRALHLRKPVLVAVDDLRWDLVHRRDLEHGVGQLALDRRGIITRQVLRRARSRRHTVSGYGPG